MNFSIAVMQAFDGLSLFSVLLLMALGLAIVFGLMGVINMAHGELMTLGAYATFLTARGFAEWAPHWMGLYLIAAIPVAFFASFVMGYVLERGFIQFFYRRPLDTLLATWGLSLIMQQAYRSIFGAGEVSVPLPQWLNGPVNLSASIQIPLNKIFIIALATVVTLGVYVLLTRTRIGLRIRAVTQNRAMSAAIGINTRRVDALTFAFGSGLAGVAGAVFTLIGSTNPGTGQMYIVNAFIVVVFGGVQSILGTILSAFTIAQSQSWLEYFLSGSMAKMTMLAIVIVVLYFRPTGLFSDKVRR